MKVNRKGVRKHRMAGPQPTIALPGWRAKKRRSAPPVRTVKSNAVSFTFYLYLLYRKHCIVMQKNPLCSPPVIYPQVSHSVRFAQTVLHFNTPYWAPPLSPSYTLSHAKQTRSTVTWCALSSKMVTCLKSLL